MGVAMNTDLLTLLDQLEEAIASAPALPVGGRIVVNRDQLLDFIDAIRGDMPDTVIEADRVAREKAKILGDAKTEADQVLERARDQASYLVQEHTVLKSAELEAERTMNRAGRGGSNHFGRRTICAGALHATRGGDVAARRGHP